MRRALDSVMAVAEARFARRSPRTWVFVALGSGCVLAAYGYYFYAHGYFSVPMPSLAYFSPRFQSAAINVYLLWIFLAAAMFSRSTSVSATSASESRRSSTLARSPTWH